MHILGADGTVVSRVNGTPEFRAAANDFLDRLRWARQVGLSFNGARDFYAVFGYDRQITTRQYREMYQRGGIAGRIVDVYPKATWRGETPFEVFEDEDPEVHTAFEQAWNEFSTRLQVPAKLLRVDKLAGLSTFAVLLIGAYGDMELPLPRGVNQKGILYLTPFGGGGGGGSTVSSSMIVSVDADAMVERYVEDTSDPRFGLPLMYRLRRTDVNTPMLQRPVHWTRIIHVAEDLLDDDVHGLPSLERVWNLLQDLDKVTGGGAEAFWLRANQGLHLNIDKDMALDSVKDTVESLKQQAEDYKHQMTRWLRTRGVDVNTLGSDVANFLNPADAILTQIAGAKGIPKRILTGSEMGELASSQDRENWRDQIIGRQTNHAGPNIVRPLVDRLVEFGYIPSPLGGPMAYKVTWPHIQVMTEGEKVQGAQGMASVNQTYGDIVYTDSEIRERTGFAPLSDDQKAQIEETKRAKVALAQELMPAQLAPAEPDADDEDTFKAAGEVTEMHRILSDAIECGSVEVVRAIVKGLS